MKTGNDGERLCEHDGCEFPATHTFVWTEQKYFCAIHVQAAVNVASAIGFPTVRNTLRAMTLEETFPEEK